LLGAEGDLARRKVFSRRHLVVALAPHLFGQDPEVLERLVDRALADPEVVPLVGVAGARERAHSLASVLARESAIAESLACQLDRTDGPVAFPESVEVAIAGAEETIGARLSDEQRAAVVGICTSGRGAELVVGVAGAGKTTMLRAVSEAFERSGHQVLGTATSGQAARNLGTEAGTATGARVRLCPAGSSGRAGAPQDGTRLMALGFFRAQVGGMSADRRLCVCLTRSGAAPE
jgi:hypothetical protein